MSAHSLYHIKITLCDFLEDRVPLIRVAGQYLSRLCVGHVLVGLESQCTEGYDHLAVRLLATTWLQ